MSGRGGAEGGASGGKSFVDQSFRRTFDVQEYQKRAAEKDKKRKEKPVALSASEQRPLQAHEKDMNFEGVVGKTQLVSYMTPAEQRGGFWCETCECLLKDSVAYLDHINGKKHNEALGMSMRAKRSTLADVRAKLSQGSKALKRASSAAGDTDTDGLAGDADVSSSRERPHQRAQQAPPSSSSSSSSLAAAHASSKSSAKEASRRGGDDDDGDDDDAMLKSMMGFTGFGSSKR